MSDFWSAAIVCACFVLAQVVSPPDEIAEQPSQAPACVIVVFKPDGGRWLEQCDTWKRRVIKT